VGRHASKAALYLEAGADEVWMVTLDRQRAMFTH
jgi:hypothetical protein